MADQVERVARQREVRRVANTPRVSKSRLVEEDDYARELIESSTLRYRMKILGIDRPNSWSWGSKHETCG
jgi:hypothetical protein